ncbi:MAG: methylenetetrahydrofolate reductase [NAD(P)H] [Deltaproteobacteria bacterium]|nr:methylenetetrahydrofolate reductase [NAD(P)H] [Deltaproteobacteria bacterium]
MRITEILKAGYPSFSFEFFPPKTPEGEADLWAALQDLKELRPSFVSVTYGAGGSTRQKTVELTRRIKHELQIEAMAHLTCVGAGQAELRGVLEELKGSGIENVLALRGDPPKGQNKFEATEGGFRYASELTEFVKAGGWDFCLGGAAYPEGHLECASKYQDLHHLKRKVDAGAQFLITQLFFDNRYYFDLVDRARSAGIHVPILAGLMPIQSAEQVKRFTKMCGVSIPNALLDRLDRHAHEPERIHELGVVHATIQALGLIQGGAPGVHFFTLNKSTATREILAALRMNARL